MYSNHLMYSNHKVLFINFSNAHIYIYIYINVRIVILPSKYPISSSTFFDSFVICTSYLK